MSDPYAAYRAKREQERARNNGRTSTTFPAPRFRRAGSVVESETDYETESNVGSSVSYGSSTASSWGPNVSAGRGGIPGPNQASVARGSTGIRQPIPQRLASYNLPGISPASNPVTGSASDVLRRRNLESIVETPSTSSSVDQFYPRKSDLLQPPSTTTTKRLKPDSTSKTTTRKRKESTLDSTRYDSPLRRYARYMARLDSSSASRSGGKSGDGPSRWSMGGHLGLIIGIVGVIGLKWLVGLGGYSGRSTPPLYGDFEAQRHWMELTANLPMKQWYSYGGEWWQLDYPPVTAYVSWVFGKVGLSLDPPSFHLLSSRGAESPFLTLYMRATVLALELVSWIPVVVAYVWYNRRDRSRRTRLIAVLTVLGWPGLVLIDNGHFQYNSFMLALTLLSVLCFQSGKDLLGCVAFSLSLGFKQMALYYSPVVFGYLVGKCLWLGGEEGFTHFVKIATVTSLTFATMFGPFLTPFPEMPLLVLHRMFPLARGIFEDKVANFWCASNVVFKWRTYFDAPTMAKMATAMTLLAFAPTLVLLIFSNYKLGLRRRPDSNVPPTVAFLPTAMLSTSLAFFLFSFQVHEKSILIPMLWALVIMALERGGGDGIGALSGVKGAEDQEESEGIWNAGALLLNVSVFSMFPLLKKDDQVLQYCVMQLLWNYLIGYNPRQVRSASLRWASLGTYTIMVAHHVLEYTVYPPARYPDIFPVTNVLLSTAVFGLAWLWANKRLLDIALRLDVFDMGI